MILARPRGRPLNGRAKRLLRTATLARSAAGGGPARGRARRQAQDFRRCGAGRRQDLRDAAGGARQAARRAWTSSSASSRPTAARRPRRCSRASRSSRASRRSTYKGQSLEEMDLDAIIARRPQIVLVDELAHTNAPGSRHPKRYLDVEELLNHGIDVYTTVNIQHIESLNDVVAQITRVRVRETVPDSVFDRADAVELVDLTPDDLIQRLKEGKVYVPKQAERALEHFFSPANLTALARACPAAHRRARRRATAQQMQARAISGPWAAGERILVCVSEDPRSAGLVRYAKRLADRLHAPWTALCVETPAQPAAQRGRARPHRRHAAACRAARRRGDHVPERRTAHRRRRDRLCAAPTTSRRSSSASRRARAGSRSCTARSCTISCGAPATSASTSLPASSCAASRSRRSPSAPRKRSRVVRPASPISSLCWPSARRSASAWLIRPWLGVENVDLVFLTAIVGVAVRYGLWPSLLASVAASLCYNFFFLPPIYTFTITDPTNVAAFVLVHGRGRHRLQCRCARAARRRSCRAGARAHHRIALCLQPQARRRRHARRRALGHGLSDRLDAEGARRAAAARGRLDRGEGRLSAGGHARRGRSRPRPTGPGRTTAPPGAAPIRCPAPSGCSCRCTPAAAPSASSASTATSRGRC